MNKLFIRLCRLGANRMMTASAYSKIWQIFGKMVFEDDSPETGKV